MILLFLSIVVILLLMMVVVVRGNVRRRQSDTAREQGRLVVKPKVVLLFSLLPSLFVFDILKKEEKEKTNDKNGKEPAESEGTKVSHEIRDDTLNNQTHTDGKKQNTGEMGRHSRL